MARVNKHAIVNHMPHWDFRPSQWQILPLGVRTLPAAKHSCLQQHFVLEAYRLLSSPGVPQPVVALLVIPLPEQRNIKHEQQQFVVIATCTAVVVNLSAGTASHAAAAAAAAAAVDFSRLHKALACSPTCRSRSHHSRSCRICGRRQDRGVRNRRVGVSSQRQFQGTLGMRKGLSEH